MVSSRYTPIKDSYEDLMLSSCIILLQGMMYIAAARWTPLQDAASTYLDGILGFEQQPLVSTDYINDRR